MSEGPETRPRSRYRGRFAPSPTGPLHLGSLLTAVASFLQAKANLGQWLLRIDDIDPERSIPAAADEIKRTLEQFGLLWDGEVVFQRDRIERYQQAFDRLRSHGLVYGCRCSRQFLTGNALYPGYCRNKRLLDQSPSHAVRVRTVDAVIRFTDRLHGVISHELEHDTGDFVIRRRDGVFAYHLATVVDDAAADVSEVLRGVDLIDSTPRQIHLQQLLNLPTPIYCHTPILVDPAGEKLSKQTFAAPVEKDNPESTLCLLLRLLRQEPPVELKHAPPREILDWAVAHWDITALRHLKEIPVGSSPSRQPQMHPGSLIASIPDRN